uniref:Aspartate beta-hydroxylase n=1 Tax=Marmota marmota marmota TaxID=9994 RepID=A0A8C5YU58_MARMA
MAPRKNAKGGGGNSSSTSGSGSGSSTSTGSSGGRSSSPGTRRETKHGGHKNGRKGGLSGSSFFTWFMVIALLGVWTSVAVVWFDLVDYEEVLGKLGVYDADGDGDFDVDDAKVLLGLKERSASEPIFPPEEAEPHAEPEEQAPEGTEPQNIEDEVREQIQSLLHETVHTEHGEDLQQDQDGPAEELPLEYENFFTDDADDTFEMLEPETVHEVVEDSYLVEEPVLQDHHQDIEEMIYDQENPDSSEPVVEDESLHQEADDVTYQDYDKQEYEPSENDAIEISDNAVEESNIIPEEVSVPAAEEQQEVPPDT